MSIISIEFFILVILSAFFYYVCPKKYRWTVMLVSSWFFIWQANEHSFRACTIMLSMILVAYFAGVIFSKVFKQSIRKTIILLSIIFEAGLLIRLKDIGFFLRLFHLNEKSLDFIYLIAPLGISYFTLSLLSYIMDTYWGTQKAEMNPFKFLLFGSWFPLLTSGPIVRYHDTGKELLKPHKFEYKNICYGTQRIMWGIFKKIVISERLALIVNTIYGDVVTYQGLYIWVAMGCFVLQLYADFSGSLDIIYGVSEIFGIHLPENFDLPFSAKNLSEFWRRWHITLGQWLKDYILYPILKSRPILWVGSKTKKIFAKKTAKKIPTWSGLFFSWFIIGFWHGGSWNYIIGIGLWMWGVIVIGDLTAPIFKKLLPALGIKTDCFSWHLIQSLRTILLFMIGLGMFRAISFSSGLEIYKAGFSTFNPWIFFNQSFLKMGLSSIDFNVLRIGIAMLAVSGAIRIVTKGSVRDWVAKQNTYLRWVIWIGMFIFILIYGKYGPGYDPTEFIYRGF